MHAYRWTPPLPRLILITAMLLTVGLGGLALQGCRSGDQPEISKGDTVRATLTAAAGAMSAATTAPVDQATPEAVASTAADVPDAPTGAPVAGQLSTPAAPGGLPAELSGQGLPTSPEEQFSNPGEVSDDPEGTAIAQRATAEATLGVANVDDLVMSMPKLATFTPAPPAKLPGQVIYVRGGALWRAQVGAKPERLPLDKELPIIWAPPQDPGRAWVSPDDKQLLLLAGSDAEPWITSIDGKGTRAIGGPALPVDVHQLSVPDAEAQTVRLKPGTNYTLIRASGGDQSFQMVADELEDERRGFGRLRFIHAAGSLSGVALTVRMNGDVFGGAMKHGRSSGELRVPAGKVTASIVDPSGKTLLEIADLNLESKEIKSVFLVDGAPLKAVPVTYVASKTPGSGSQMRVFNAAAAPLTVTLDGKTKMSNALASGAIGPYARIDAILNTDQRSDIELAVYGNKTREFSVAWSPKSDRLVYLAAGDGNLDLYLSDLKGQPKRLTSDPASQLNPVWAPDGGHVAWYNSEANVILYSVQVAKADGSDIKTVDFAPIRKQLGLPPTDKLFFPQDVIWVDATRFVLIPRTNTGPIGMWLYDVTTGGINMLTDKPVHAVEWSAVAKAFLLTPDKDTGEIIRLDLDGKRRTLIKGQAYYPIWSPDGSRISYIEGHQTDSRGWVLHIMDADGGNDRALTPRWPLVQAEPPVPGPRAKRIWLDGGKTLVFSRVGSDYGAADRAGIGRLQSAGADIENFYAVAVDAKTAAPKQLTDLTQAFYLTDLSTDGGGKAMAFIGLWYQSRTQQLWAAPSGGGKPLQIDGPVRWFTWVR